MFAASFVGAAVFRLLSYFAWLAGADNQEILNTAQTVTKLIRLRSTCQVCAPLDSAVSGFSHIKEEVRR